MDTVTDPIIHALRRLTVEVAYMIEAPTKELIISAETQLAFDEAIKALESIGESISEDDS